MKKTIIGVIVYFIFNYSNSQSFEGKLEYIVDTQILGDSIIKNVSKNKLIESLKQEGEIPNDTVTYFYSKSGDYVFTSSYKNVKFINTYLRKNNLIYHFIGELNIVSAIITTIDLEEKLGDKPKIRILDETEKIGSFECSIVEVKWKSGTYRYYYSNILKINPELYRKYNYEQFYNYLKVAKALPLKVEKVINNFYKTTYELHSYVKEDINKDIFDIPKMEENKDLNNIYPNKKFFTIKD